MVSIESRAPVHPLLCLITVEDRWIWGCFCKANATSHCANVNGGESKYFHHQAIFCNTILRPVSLFPLRRRCAAHALPMRRHVLPCQTRASPQTRRFSPSRSDAQPVRRHVLPCDTAMNSKTRLRRHSGSAFKSETRRILQSPVLNCCHMQCIS